DFVLRWRTAGERERTHICVTRQGEHVYDVLSLVAPSAVNSPTTGARDVVFLVDRSGSMQGDKMSAARKAVVGLLRQLAPGDRFTIAVFDDVVEWFTGAAGPAFVEATGLVLASASQWLESVDARRGTELALALERTLEAAKSMRELHPERTSVLVLVT